MRAWLLDRMEGLAALRIGEAADPVPAAGEVVVDVELAALNPADRYLAEGQYPGKPKMPHILGRDGIGTVTAVGAGVTNVCVGDRRIFLRGDAGVNRPGTFAQRVAVPVEWLVDVPTGWSDEQAAGAALVYVTAYQALTQWGELPPSVVLVSGASCGVGVATTQLASAMGHTVVALSRSAAKSEKLKNLGATITLDPNEPDWPAKLKKQLDKRRVDLAVDNIGGPAFTQIIETLGNNGRVSVVGRLAGVVPEFNTASLIFRRVRIGGVAIATYTNAENRAAWGEIVKVLAAANARPVVDRIFEFQELPAAFARLSEGPMGKVLLKVK
jgi:NADPH2:quinone reductase